MGHKAVFEMQQHRKGGEDIKNSKDPSQVEAGIYHGMCGDEGDVPVATTTILDLQSQTTEEITDTGSSIRRDDYTVEIDYDNGNDPTLTRKPITRMKCPHCHDVSTTRITTKPSWITWTAVFALFVLFWPLCWIPLVVTFMKQTDHYCELCDHYVGSVGAFQDCFLVKEQERT